MWNLIREFFQFIREEKKWWLAPLVIVLLLLGIIIVFGSTSNFGSLMYPFL